MKIKIIMFEYEKGHLLYTCMANYIYALVKKNYYKPMCSENVIILCQK